MSGLISLLVALAAIDISIVEPEDGGIYDDNWLTIRAIAENDNELPDSVVFSLNGAPFVPVPRLVTDWPTYMQNNQNHGFSESPAPMTDEVFWTAPVCNTLHTFENPVIVDGVVYQVGQGMLFALETATGQEIWNYPLGTHDDPPSYVDGFLYVAADSIYCIAAAAGERVWTFPDADWYGSTPCVMDGRVACATSSMSKQPYFSTVFCLSASDGQIQWSDSIEGAISSCIAGWNGMFFVPTYEGPLYALDAETGQVIWSHTVTEDGYWDTSPTIVDGKIYICGEDGAVHKFDAMTGALEWEAQISTFHVTSTPALFEDKIICGSDTAMFALRMSDGSTVWTYANSIHGSPAVADGMVFWGGHLAPYSNVYAADAATGEILWMCDVSADVWGLHCTPSITDGVMYFGSTDGNLYAFGTGLKWTYRDDLFADLGSNQLIVDSWSGGAVAASDTINFTVTQTGIETDPMNPRDLAIGVSPNPFAASTAVSFEPVQSGHHTIAVFNLAGRLVRTIGSGEFTPGPQTLSWDGADESGGLLPTGIYVIRVSGPMGTAAKSVCLLR